MKKPIIIAHRGASAVAPENTVASFNKALKMGAGGIEFDVQLSRDGVPVIIHDSKVERTSNGTGWVKDKDLKELKSLDFGGWFSSEFKGETIPTLEEVLELLIGWDGLINIEIKNGPVFYAGIEKKVIELVKAFGMMDRVIISSFNHYSLMEVKKIHSEARIGLLYTAGLFAPWEYAGRLRANAVHPLFHSVLPEIVKGCKENGIAVNPYTVDEPDSIRNMAASGVDGIITNVPDLAFEALNRE